MAEGFRVSRYIGGYEVEEVAYIESGTPPLAGAMDGQSKQLFFGSLTEMPERSGCVYSLGLQKGILGSGIFNVHRTSSSSARVTSLCLVDNNSMSFESPLIGTGRSLTSGGEGGIDYEKQTGDYSIAPSVWWSQIYRIGQLFKITKIRIPMAQELAVNMEITPKIYLDSGVETKTLTTINSSNFGTGKRNIVIRPENLTGNSDFFIELRWTGSVLCVVSLPILIEYELLDD